MTSISVRGTLVVLAASFIAALSLAPVASAEPTGEYAVFKECPLSVAKINACVYAVTESGEVAIGESKVNIVNPIVFQGGETRELVTVGEEETEVRKFVGAANGETLTKVAQPVPGGLLGLIKCEEISDPLVKLTCEAVFEKGLTEVTATTELVGEASYSFTKLANAEPEGLVMPVRIHLQNILLGSSCYIGSASEPITFRFTTGTTSPPPPNEPITGSPGLAEVLNGGSLVIDHGSSIVDNSFAAPEATGCGGLLASVINPIINAKLGLPSTAGHNTARLNNTLQQATASAVRKSE